MKNKYEEMKELRAKWYRDNAYWYLFCKKFW